MRPAPVSPQWRKIATARMFAQPSTSVRRRLKSKPPQSNLLRRLLGPRRFSKWVSTVAQRFAMAMTMTMTIDGQIYIFAAMQTPVAKLTDELWGLVRVQTDHPELLSPTPLSQHIGRHTVEELENARLADKAVSWMLAPVFFCCVVAEKAKSPRTWGATEIFSRVVVSFMLKLFVLTTDLAWGKHHAERAENK
ncbi:hypothetical protein ON010_g6889 [Phytophthora cinnamomi]|nr:hypothetical protein ON010_g6889 [Phytophthora cinnamomi]